MNKQDIIETHKQYVMPTYAPGLTFIKGKGTRLWDADDQEYLDFLSGIAVTNLGHCHPALVKAIKKQASRLMHVSNLYYNEHQPYLAEALSRHGLGGKCFFCNSGAEANEGLIKLARLWGHEKNRYEIITMENSFHGRTLATLTATGQDKVKHGFEPLPEGFKTVPYNDLEKLEAAISSKTVAVLLEAVQGEGGVLPADADYMQAVQRICADKKILMLVDEVQTGIGRTGKWFGYQRYGIKPDAISVAKGLGGGFPIGAVLTSPELADVFQPGHHATTFGGSPLAAAAARAVVETIEEDNLTARAEEMGALLMTKLQRLIKKYDFVKEVRGHGLMVGVVFDRPAKDFEVMLQQKGLITLATAGNVIRMLPPLTVKKSEIGKAVSIFKECLSDYQKQQ